MPLYRSIKQFSSSYIGLWFINESYDQLYNEIKDYSFDLSQLDDFNNELKKKQWLASRCLIKEMNQGVGRISYNVHGAPHTDNGIYISLSHSNNMVAVILDSKVDTGIDIQISTEKIERIKRKFCNAKELDFATGEKALDKLHLIWSAKESLYKQLKIPGLIFRKELDIDPFIIEDKGELKASILRDGKTERMNLRYEILDEYTFVYTLNS